MKKHIFLLLFLSGCVPHWADYQPKLATAPKNHAKYEADRKYCLDDAMARSRNAGMNEPDAYKFPREIVDECMTAKGYDVVKIERHGLVNFE